MKNVLKSKKVIIVSLITLVAISLSVIATFALTGVFNRRLEIQIITEKDTVKTGEIQKVLIRNVYSNPNDGNSEKIRIHLKTAEGQPNTAVKLLNVTDGKIDYICENNKELTVSVYLKEEKDENEKIIDYYLEYTLPPGSSTDMELEFIVEAGEYGLVESLKLETEIVDGKKADNDKIDENVTINWIAEYLWDNFETNTSISNIEFNDAGIVNNQTQYTYSLENKMKEKNGSVYTKKIEIENKIIFPEGVTLPQGTQKKDENKITNSKGETICEINVEELEYQIEGLTIEKDEEELDVIKYKIIIENDNIENYEFNPIDKIKVNLNFDKLNIDTRNLEKQNIKAMANLTVTSVDKKETNMLIATYTATSNTIINFVKTGDVTITKDVISIRRPKNADATEMEYSIGNKVRPKYTIDYRIKVSNNSGLDITNSDIIDTLPAVLTLNNEPELISSTRGKLTEDTEYSFTKDDNTNELKFNISEIKNTEIITINYQTKVNSENFVYGEEIINKASIGNKEAEAKVIADPTQEISLEKKIISRTYMTVVGSPVKIWRDLQTDRINYSGDYFNSSGTINPSQSELEESLLEAGPGDIIEYMIIFDNPTSTDYSGEIHDYQPFAYGSPEINMGQNVISAFHFSAFVKKWEYYILGTDQYCNEENIENNTAVSEIYNNCIYRYTELINNAYNKNEQSIFYGCRGNLLFRDSLKAYTKYKQTVVLKMPGSNDKSSESNINYEYQDFIATYAYESKNGQLKPFNTLTQFIPTDSRGEENGNYVNSKVISHYPAQQIYINTGSLGKGAYENGKIITKEYNRNGLTSNAYEYEYNARTYKVDDKEALVNYVYLYNDSYEKMKISDYQINIYIPDGFELLGLVSEVTDTGPQKEYRNIVRGLYEGSYSGSTCIWVNNTRKGSPFHKLESHTSYNQFEKDTSNNKIYLNINGGSDNKYWISSLDSIEPYSGILLLYAVKVNEEQQQLLNNEGNKGATFAVEMQRCRKNSYNIKEYAKQISPVIKATDYWAAEDGPHKYREYVSNDGICIGHLNCHNNNNMYRFVSNSINPNVLVTPYKVFSYFTVQKYEERTNIEITKNVVKNNGEESETEYDKKGENIAAQAFTGPLSTGFDTNYDDYTWEYPLTDGIHRTVDGTVTWEFKIKNTGDVKDLPQISNNSNINTVPLGEIIEYKPINYQTIIDTVDSPYKLKEIYIPTLVYYSNGKNGKARFENKIISNDGGYFELPDSDPANKDEMIEAGWTYIEDKGCFVYEAISHSGTYVGKTSNAPYSYENMNTSNAEYYIRVTVKNLENKSLASGYDVENGEENKNAYQYIIEFMNNYSGYEPLLLLKNEISIYLTFSTNDSIETNYNSCALVLSEENANSNIMHVTKKALGIHKCGEVIGADNDIITAYKPSTSDHTYTDLGYGSVYKERLIIEDNDWTDTSYTDGENSISKIGEDNKIDKTVTSRKNGNVAIEISPEGSNKIKGKLKVESVLEESENYLDFHDLVIYDLYGKEEKNDSNLNKSAYNIDFKTIKVTDSKRKTYVLGRDYEIYYTKTNLITKEDHPLENVKTLEYAADWNKIETQQIDWLKYDGITNLGEDSKGFKIVFLGDNGTVENKKLQEIEQREIFEIYVDYEGSINKDAEAKVDHPNILAYTAKLNDISGEEKPIKEDTTAINVKINRTEIELTKKIVNRDNEEVKKCEEEFEFLIIKSESNTLNKSTIEAIAKVKIKAGRTVDIGKFENIEIIYEKEENQEEFYQSDKQYTILEIPEEGYNQENIESTEEQLIQNTSIDFTGIEELENNENINNIPINTIKLKNCKNNNNKITFINKYDTSIEIKKVDEAQEIIRNSVTFNIYDEEENILKFKKEGAYYNYEETESEGLTEQITFSGITRIYNLPYGKYKLEEANPPIGYAKAETKEIIIEKSQNGQKIEISVENKLDKEQEISKINITKTNNITKEKINGITKFELYDSAEETAQPIELIKEYEGIYTHKEESAEKITELSTYNGQFTIYNLPIGTYYLKEIQAPSGYIKDEKLIEIEIKTSKDEIVKNIENTPIGNLQIIKEDSQGNPLENVKFEIVDLEENEVKFIAENDEYTYSKEGETTELITNEDGRIIISDIPLGKYKIKELETLETFELCKDTEIEIKEENFETTKIVKIINKHNIGNAQIVKTDIDGNIIESNQIGFKIYNEENNVIRFEDNKIIKQEGKEYRYSEEGSYTTIMADNGKLYISNLPIGKYYVEEVIAPQGYTKIETKKEFEITDENYFTAKTVKVKNADYVFGSEKYISTSYQKIEEKDDENNYGYSYFGKEKDYEEGNKNYIVVDDKKDTVTYTLRVNNMSEKNFEKVSIINKLPSINDFGVVNNEENRNSEFDIKLADEPNIKINILDYEGSKQEIFKEYYKIEYSEETTFSDDDWNGVEDTEKWHDEKTENTKSFRIIFSEEFILPSKYTIQVEFDGSIQENAQIGQIAWNSFAYRYYIEDRFLTPEPPKVGVKIPYTPEITKKAIGTSKGTYTFEIIDTETNEKIDSIDINVNETKELPIKRTINGITTGSIEAGKRYIIKEKANTQTKVATVEGIGGDIEKDSFILTYNPEEQANVTFTNKELDEATIKIIKKDKDTGEKIDNVKFELTDEENNIIKLKLEDGKYEVDDTGEETITTIDGTAIISNLSFGTYYLREVETLDRYILEDKEKIKVEINENSYEIKEGVTTNIPKEIEFLNEKNKITIEKKWNNILLSNAELSIIDANTEKIIDKFITEGKAYTYRGLPIGDYILREENSPTGFNKADDIKFSVNKYGEIYVNSEKVEKIEMQDNMIEGTIKIVKKGEKLKASTKSGQYEYETGTIEGVVFELFAGENIEYQNNIIYKKDESITQKVTDKNGKVIFDKLPIGNYYVIEKEAPAEYIVKSEKINFKIGYNEEKNFTVEKEIINERKIATIIINKKDRKTNKSLEGAEFGLYNSKGNLIEYVTTNEEGYAKFTTDIPIGIYTVREIKAPTGYIESKEYININFGEESQFNLTIYNDKKEDKKINVALPYTGDNLPIIAGSIIALVIISNIIEIVIERKLKNKKTQ